MVETQLCKLRGTLDTLVRRACSIPYLVYSIFYDMVLAFVFWVCLVVVFGGKRKRSPRKKMLNLFKSAAHVFFVFSGTNFLYFVRVFGLVCFSTSDVHIRYVMQYNGCGLEDGANDFTRTYAVNPFRVPFWGQISQISSSLSPKRDCGSKGVNSKTS